MAQATAPILNSTKAAKPKAASLRQLFGGAADLVTAYPNDVHRVRVLNDGVVCCLRKPVIEQHLKRRLHAALTSSE